jgi:hypothetical protein
VGDEAVSTDDIGNWGQTLGLINVVTELSVIALAARAVLRRGPLRTAAHTPRG